MPDYRLSDLVGAYHLEELLGTGGFGSVWRARDVRSGETVALKLLTGRYSTADVARQRAEIELLAAAASQASEHVVRVLGGGVDPVPHVVMEFVDGANLATQIRAEGPLGLRRSIEIGLAVADALGALAESGIVHRDVKPANVIIDQDGVAKLTDFGIAKIVGYESATATSSLPLSMAYAAPEAWDGAPVPQSDLYALGVLVYECVVGHPPFQGAPTELLRQHASARPDLTPLPADTPPSLIEFLASCMTKSLAQRMPDAATCTKLLNDALEELDPGLVRGVVIPRLFGPWIRRGQVSESTWDCVDRETGATGLVEVFSSDELELGARLKAAVDANPALVPFGAEQLLGANRLMLRPGEVLTPPVAGSFQFWVARRLDKTPAFSGTVPLELIEEAAESLEEMIEAAGAGGVQLSFRGLSLLPDGRVHVSRPGLPPTSNDDPRVAALSWLRTLPTTPAGAARLARAVTLSDLRDLTPPPGAGQAEDVAKSGTAVAGVAGRALPRRWAIGAGVGGLVILAAALWAWVAAPIEPQGDLPSVQPAGAVQAGELALVPLGLISDTEREEINARSSTGSTFGAEWAGYRFKVEGTDLTAVALSPQSPCPPRCQRGSLTWDKDGQAPGFARETDPQSVVIFLRKSSPSGDYGFTVKVPDGRTVSGVIALPPTRGITSLGSVNAESIQAMGADEVSVGYRFRIEAPDLADRMTCGPRTLCPGVTLSWGSGAEKAWARGWAHETVTGGIFALLMHRDSSPGTYPFTLRFPDGQTLAGSVLHTGSAVRTSTSPASTPAALASVVLADDFAGPRTGRIDWVTNGLLWDILDQELRLRLPSAVTAAHLGGRFAVKLPASATDVSTTVDARVVSGRGVQLAIVCRGAETSPSLAGYRFAWQPDAGLVWLVRATANVNEDILLFQGVAPTRQTPELSQLRLDCVGSELTGYVNGVVVAKATDATYRTGHVRLSVSAGTETQDVEVRFDNLVVSTPRPPAIPAASPNAAPTTRSPSTRILSDDFSSAASGVLGTFERAGSSARYSAGTYLLTLNVTPGSTGISGSSRESYQSTVDVEVDARPLNVDSVVGITCRSQAPGSGQYYLHWNADRQLIRLGVSKADLSFVELTAWTPVAGATTAGMNRLRLRCDGDLITGAVGSTEIAARDGTHSSGKVGVQVFSQSGAPGGTATGSFDNFELRVQ